MNFIGVSLETRPQSLQKNDSISALIIIALLAFVYGCVLASLPLYVFRDRENYLRYAQNSWPLLEFYWAISPLAALANEPVWLFINAGLSKVFQPETVLRLIIFFPATLVGWKVLRQDLHSIVLLFLFLLVPQVIVHHVCMLRQGVAIAIFLTGWFAHRKLVRLFLIAITPFVHSSFFIVLILLAITKLSSRFRFGTDVRTLLFIGSGLALNATLILAAAFLGARQANEDIFLSGNLSGFGFAFWGIVLVIMSMQGKVFIRRYAFEIGTIIFYLSTYFLNKFSARVFESTIILVLIAGLQLSHWRKHIFIALIVSFSLLQYTFRLNQPWLGWGVL
jgi:hypothetical protein